mmetsp:Transcript_80755/g.140187  ORF Transcript_80755/g.140187 Transcript_80755/m.140187 type:complete len:104 (-) Transcript_80755:604-915(-)
MPPYAPGFAPILPTDVWAGGRLMSVGVDGLLDVVVGTIFCFFGSLTDAPAPNGRFNPELDKDGPDRSAVSAFAQEFVRSHCPMYCSSWGVVAVPPVAVNFAMT